MGLVTIVSCLTWKCHWGFSVDSATLPPPGCVTSASMDIRPFPFAAEYSQMPNVTLPQQTIGLKMKTVRKLYIRFFFEGPKKNLS